MTELAASVKFGESQQGEWGEGECGCLNAPVHSATAWVSGGVECDTGTHAGLDTVVWALGIPSPTQLLLPGEKEGTQLVEGEFMCSLGRDQQHL